MNYDLLSPSSDVTLNPLLNRPSLPYEYPPYDNLSGILPEGVEWRTDISDRIGMPFRVTPMDLAIVGGIAYLTVMLIVIKKYKSRRKRR